MNEQQENIQGHPRSFVAAYAKDLVCALVSSTSDMSGKKVLDSFDVIADHMYNWVMQDQLKDCTPAQDAKIDQLIRLVKPEPKTMEKINAERYKYNIKEAGDLIEELQKQLLPDQYADYINSQSAAMKATANRTERE